MSKANIALLITDKFLKANSNVEFEGLVGYWSTLRKALEKLLTSPAVHNLHKHVTTPEALDAFCVLQRENYIDPVMLIAIAKEADHFGFFNTITDNPTVDEAHHHVVCHIEFYGHQGDHMYEDGYTDCDAEKLHEFCKDQFEPAIKHLFWAYKIGLLN